MSWFPVTLIFLPNTVVFVLVPALENVISLPNAELLLVSVLPENVISLPNAVLLVLLEFVLVKLRFLPIAIEYFASCLMSISRPIARDSSAFLEPFVSPAISKSKPIATPLFALLWIVLPIESKSSLG